MSLVSLIIPLILLGIALWLIGAFIKICLGLFRFDLKGLKFNREIKAKKKLLVEADSLVEAKNFLAAADLLRRSLIFERSAVTEQALRQISDHNISVLARIAALGVTLGVTTRNLPLLEELFLSRVELLNGYRSEVNLLKRHKKTWANDGIRKKLLELEERLDTNQKSITTQLEEALNVMVTSKSAGEVTYH